MLPAAALAVSALKLTVRGELMVDANRAILIGIGADRVEQMNQILKPLQNRVLEYENNTAVRRSEASGEYYSILADKSLQLFFEKTVNNIRSQFIDNPPAGEALLTAIFHGSNYSSFGKYNEEISIRESSIPGRNENITEVILIDPETGKSIGGRSSTFNGATIVTRYPFFGKR